MVPSPLLYCIPHCLHIWLTKSPQASMDGYSLSGNRHGASGYVHFAHLVQLPAARGMMSLQKILVCLTRVSKRFLCMSSPPFQAFISYLLFTGMTDPRRIPSVYFFILFSRVSMLPHAGGQDHEVPYRRHLLSAHISLTLGSASSIAGSR